MTTKKTEVDFQTRYQLTEPVWNENQTSALYYDKRLYEIYQCSQAKFLDKNFEPNKAIVAQESIHPNIKTYSYFISGLQIEREIFTVKSVIGISNQNQACYYDHKLISIDKKLLIESAINKKERIFCSGFAGSKPAGLQKISLYNYDKRLYEICQEPLFGKSRFQCRFISLAVPSGKYTFTIFLRQFYKYATGEQRQKIKLSIYHLECLL